MFQKLTSIEIFVGIVGVLVVANGLFMLFSSKYYNSLSKTFFIEKISDQERQKLDKQIQDQNAGSRYIICIIVIFFGSTAIMWALGIKSALGWPFNLLF